MDRIVAHFKRQNVAFMWVIHPSSPPGMEDRLKARGLQEAEVVPGMVIHLSQLPEPDPIPDGFEIREIITSEDVRQILEFITWRWNVPVDVKEHLQAVTQPFKVGHAGSRTRAWAAFKDGVIVSKVTTHYGDAGDVGLYGVATHEKFRGLGLARILIVEALKAIRENNYQISVLHSSPMAESLYRKIGFETVATFYVYTSTGAPL
jgi:ribosomal protein S18 acetylase RimI-like enzyme